MIFRNRKLVARNLSRRAVAGICIVVGIVAVKLLSEEKPSQLSQFTVQIPDKPETVTGGRHISDYDFGGYVPDCFGKFDYAGLRPEEKHSLILEEKICVERKENARKLVEYYWAKKSRAYLVLDRYIVDSFIEDYVFIEPSIYGWRIVIRTLIPRADFEKGGNVQQRTAYGIKRRLTTQDDFKYKVGTPIVVFVDEDGNEIADL